MTVFRVLTPGIRMIGTPALNFCYSLNSSHRELVFCQTCQHLVPQKIGHTSREITIKSNHFNNSEKEPSQNKESSEGGTCSNFDKEFYDEKKLNEENLGLEKNPSTKITRTPPSPPTTCCMSGCANCVWIQYAEEMKEFYSLDGIEKALKEIETIEDVSLKAFLKLELSFLKK